jgi:integrase
MLGLVAPHDYSEERRLLLPTTRHRHPGVPRGARSRLSVGDYRRAYRLAVARAELPDLDPHGPHDLRHTFATWLEDGAVPARVIDELMGHQAGRRGEREGSMIGTRYRHMTEAMQARVVAVIAERLAVALDAMPQVCPKPGSEGEAACGGRTRHGG